MEYEEFCSVTTVDNTRCFLMTSTLYLIWEQRVFSLLGVKPIKHSPTNASYISDATDTQDILKVICSYLKLCKSMSVKKEGYGPYEINIENFSRSVELMIYFVVCWHGFKHSKLECHWQTMHTKLNHTHSLGSNLSILLFLCEEKKSFAE